MTEKEFCRLLGREIEETRISKGISREALAKMIKVSRIQIFRIEKGGTTTTTSLFKIAKALGVKVADLVN